MQSGNGSPNGNSNYTTTYGTAVELGEGSARSFVTLNKKGIPMEIGVRITETALQGLPMEEPMNPTDLWYLLPLPSQAALTPFNHLSLDWNPHGHEPTTIYTLPHFDLHFYMISPEERQTIAPNDPRGEFNLPAPQYLPANYVPGPGTVPSMGKHWLDPSGPEFQGQTFTQTFIYGTFDGQVSFLEPMFTLDFLKQTQHDKYRLPQPQAVSRTGLYYPTRYTYRLDHSNHEYVIVLYDMVLR
ncbi:DUF5602 domain-containing protein [Hymenobacter sp. 5414T-23]|nr:DUF5602 domain-containing protein [Hymenobacter sp. 5414T-23]UOQ80354.1 DUF5602 domain-containing protein [Hymenobacter sp. 5414T-23]